MNTHCSYMQVPAPIIKRGAHTPLCRETPSLSAFCKIEQAIQTPSLKVQTLSGNIACADNVEISQSLLEALMLTMCILFCCYLCRVCSHVSEALWLTMHFNYILLLHCLFSFHISMKSTEVQTLGANDTTCNQ